MDRTSKVRVLIRITCQEGPAIFRRKDRTLELIPVDSTTKVVKAIGGVKYTFTQERVWDQQTGQTTVTLRVCDPGVEEQVFAGLTRSTTWTRT